MRYRIFVLFFVSVAAFAQQPNASSAPAFETASIRTAKVSLNCASMLPPGGVQYAVTCMTLKNLIQIAYGSGYVEGGGSAMDAVYDLRATAPGGVPWTQKTVDLMMQKLLTERLHLVVHTGKRELSGYSLVVAKSGSRLKPTEADPAVQGQKAGQSSANFAAPGYVEGRSVNSKGVAGLLGMAVHAPVEDHTGLSGIYNVDLRYAPESLPDSNPGSESNASLPSFFTAVEEQLGLRLVAQKIFVDTVVVDHADGEPTPN